MKSKDMREKSIEELKSSVVDYKKFLTAAEFDRFQYSIYNLFYSIQEYPTDNEILDIENRIESKVDLLYVK